MLSATSSELPMVVSDTGPLISLEKIPGGFELAKRMFGSMIVPPEVLEELTDGFETPSDYLLKHGISHVIQVKTVDSWATVAGIERLDRGEVAAISLAISLELPLLIEEQEGRRVALAAGIPFSGLAGALTRAARDGNLQIGEAMEALSAMLSAGRINRQVYESLRSQLQA